MIVVIGEIGASGGGPGMAPSGLAAGIALAAAAAEARVELVARLGDDPAGDAVLLAFAAAGVGHVATLRDAAHATRIVEPAAEPMDPDGLDGDDVGGARSADERFAPTLDAADVGLAMRYLDDYRVIVLVHPADDSVLREVVRATDWATAHLVVVSDPTASAPKELPADAVVLAAPDDAAGLAGVLGRYAAAVDGGDAPATAFRAIVGTLAAAAG